MPERPFEIFSRHATRAKDGRLLARDIDDGRFDADLAGTAVKDEVDGGPQVLANVVSRRGTDRAEAIGGRCRDSASERREKRKRDWMVRHPQPDGLEAPGHSERNAVASPQDEGQGTRPEALGQEACRLWYVRYPILELIGAADMDDERMRGGSPLDREDTLDGADVFGIRTESVDGFGGEGNEASCAQHAGSLLDVVGLAHQSRRFQSSPCAMVNPLTPSNSCSFSTCIQRCCAAIR